MNKEQNITYAVTTRKNGLLYYLLVALTAEKVIQHIYVTLAFYFDWSGIRSTVAVNPDILMILGAFSAVLFMVSLWGWITHRHWVVNLVMALALLDIVGEFVAQGKIGIQLNVSFLVATLLVILVFLFRRKKSLRADRR